MGAGDSPARFETHNWIAVQNPTSEFLIVGLVFGTKRLRNMGDDLGTAIKGFRKGMRDTQDQGLLKADSSGRPEDAEAVFRHADWK